MRLFSTHLLMASFTFLSLFLFLPQLNAQAKVTSIDYYGLRTIKQEEIEAVLDIKSGEPLNISLAEIASRIEKLSGVAEVKVAPVQYPGNHALFIGIRETDQPTTRFREPPTGEVKLDPELAERYDEIMKMLMPAIRSGKAGEDRSAGHSISEYGPMQEKQSELPVIANREFDSLSKVLRESSDADSRTAAAYIIAYATDKSRVVDALQIACDDANSTVRNNVVRALAVLCTYADENPEANLKVDPTPFLQLLSSVTWTDRNKGAAAVDSITSGRNPELMQTLADKSLPELIEMARWKSDGHAFFSIRILARIAGVPEDEIMAKSRQLKSHEDRKQWIDELLEAIKSKKR